MNKNILLFLVVFIFPISLMGQNIMANPGFESGDSDLDGVPDDWISYSQGAGTFLELVNDSSSANSGGYYVKVTSDTGRFHILYQNSYVSKAGDVWEWSAYIKDLTVVDPGRDAARLKISARNEAGGNLKSWEIQQVGVTSNWQNFSYSQVMPMGTYGIQVSIVTHVADNEPAVTYAYDDVKLELLYTKPEVSNENNILANPGFEDGDADTDGVPDSWLSYSQGAGTFLELVNDADSANTGQYYVKVTSDTGRYHILYQQSYPANPGEVYELSVFIKELTKVDPGRDAARLKISARNEGGGNLKSWEIQQVGITDYWKYFSYAHEMPEGTHGIQVSIVTHVADDEPAVTYAYDDVKLELVYVRPEKSDLLNVLANPGFEEGDLDVDGIPDGWIGYAQTGASLELMNDVNTAGSGNYWVKCTSTEGGYYLLYQNTFPANPGEVWRLSAFFKDISPSFPGGYYSALKISAKNSGGDTFQTWEVYQDSITSYWKKFSNEQEMPEGTSYIQAVIVIHAADGAPEATYGVDDVSLELVPVLIANPGFEEGDSNEDGIPDSWLGGGTAGVTHMETVNDTTAHTGNYWAELFVDEGNGYYLCYLDPLPATAGEVWSFRSYIKSTSPDSLGDFAYLKMTAKNGSGSNLSVWEVRQIGVTREWQDYSITYTMPVGTEKMQPSLLVKKSAIDSMDASVIASYGFDDVRLVKLGSSDITPPTAPTGLTVTEGTESYSNLITWTDVAEETGEVYYLYASNNPISTIDDSGVELLMGNISKGTQTYTHYLRNPFEDKELTFYYAITATDTAANTSEPTVSSSITNTAQATATISFVVPENFVADGEVSEWDSLGVMPFWMKPSVSHVGTGEFMDDSDLIVKGYLGVDDDNLYLSFDIYDDIYSFSPATTYYKNDVLLLHIGFYNQTTKHMDTQRGEEPDYRFNFLSTYIRNVNAGVFADTLYKNGDENYSFVNYEDNHYVVEAKIPFEDILVGNQSSDTRFYPQNKMKIALDIEICDSDDYGVRNGLLTLSPENDDLSWKGPATWTYTWILDTTVTDLDDDPGNVVNKYELKQNYPNPFNPVTLITYSLAKPSKVSITIYDILGKKVVNLVNEKQDAGAHKIQFNAHNLSTGLYFYQIKADKFVKTRKMLLVK